MDEKELKAKAERYVELLSSYDQYVEAMEKVVQKITETRKELMFLEEELEKAGTKIKDVE
tara:strand:+ start:67 stop:246 length:180 start_codon:yes stop_codon:yes gene_type:complete